MPLPFFLFKWRLQMAVRQLSDGAADGNSLGQSATDKVSFYGATPVVRGATAAAVSTSASILVSSGYGFSSQAQADSIVTLVNALRLAMLNAGLIG